MARAMQTEKSTILSLMFSRSHTYRERAAVSQQAEDGSWTARTFQELQGQSKNFSNYLINSGIEYGDNIAILSESCSEWGVAFFAAIRAGAVVVPIDPKATAEELAFILGDCRPRVIIASPQQLEKLEFLQADTELRKVRVIATRTCPGCAGIEDLSMQSISDLTGRERKPSETLLIVYTSGTTGCAKGVMLSFETVLFQIRNIERILNSNAQDVFLSVLPMNHVLELVCGFLAPLFFGAQICYGQSLHPQEIFAAMQNRKVSWMYVVPNFLALLKRSLEREFKSSKSSKSSNNNNNNNNNTNDVVLMRAKFGASFKGFVCGGAPLDADVEAFFQSLGISVFQGYGLTETGPTIASNSPGHRKFGTVGKPMRGVEVRIVDGEIQARGPNLMQGYYKQPEATKSVIDQQGWFSTGDLGRLDEEGFLTVTGRLKNLIVLGSGKKVTPEEVEEAIVTAPLVKDAIVSGITLKEGTFVGTQELVVTVVPTPEMQVWLDEDRPAAEMELRDQITSATACIAAFKRPRKIYIRSNEFDRTSSNKVQRAKVEAWLTGKEPIKSWI